MADEQVGLERIRMIVIDARAFLERQTAAVAIVPIVLEKRDAVPPHLVENRFRDGCLAGTRTPCNADQDRFHGSYYTTIESGVKKSCRDGVPFLPGAYAQS